MKILCVLLPNFPLRCELLRSPGFQGGSVVTYSVGSQKLVLDYSPELPGLQRDMPLQQALALHGEIKVISADMPYYRSVFDEILDALELKSPLVEGFGLGHAYLGLDGLQSIYPTVDVLAGAVREIVPAVFDVRLGIASGKFPAYLAALYSPPGSYKTMVENIDSFLNDLPCNVLPVSLKSKNKLHEFGLHTLGQVAALLPGPLQAQFGPEGKRIKELAVGHDDTPLYPRLTEEVIEERTTLLSMTVSLDVLLMTLEAMLTHAFARLAPRGMGISRINLWTMTWVSEHWERNIPFKEPAMNAKAALSRIKQIIENAPQPGPVEQLGMKITGLGRRQGRQKSLFLENRAQDNLLNDIKQLEFRLGGPQLFKFKEVEPWSRIPERRHALTPLSR